MYAARLRGSTASDVSNASSASTKRPAAKMRLTLMKEINRTRDQLVVGTLPNRCGPGQCQSRTGNQYWGPKAHSHLLGPGGSNMGEQRRATKKPSVPSWAGVQELSDTIRTPDGDWRFLGIHDERRLRKSSIWPAPSRDSKEQTA